MDELTREFLIESQEGLDRMERCLTELEEHPRDGELLAEIFRSVHTIKGTTGFLGYARLESLSHAGENLLGKLRDGGLIANREIIDGLLALLDGLRGILVSVEADGKEGAGDDRALLERLLEAQQDDGNPMLAKEALISGGREDAGDQAAVISATADSTLRVDVELLNRMMNLVGELVLTRNRILQVAASDAGFTLLSHRLDMVTADLREAVMEARMQPVGHVFSKFPRLVRDLARQLGKRVRLEMEGQETELDKSLLEAIKDPLTHAVRNAMDHGLEPPAAREKAGKPAEGVLKLRAFQDGSCVVVEVTDDGGGIRVEKVRERAIERRLITAAKAAQMNEREMLQLIFLPGFSTAEAVTNVSGRGVGMDVVRNNVEKIGGKVEIDSCPEKGTTLRLRVPLTVAIVPALIVRAGGQSFALPQGVLDELVCLAAEQAERQIEWLENTPVYRLRSRILPLVFLSRMLGIENAIEKTPGRYIAVLNADGRRFGLVVDGLADPEEIVVKPLSPVLKRIGLFSGATVMGNGEMALILDIGAVAARNLVGMGNQTEDLAEPAGATESRDEFLLAETRAERLALPLGSVVRIERVPRSSMERIGRIPALRFGGELLPVAIEDQCDDGAETTVVVCRDGDRHVGLAVSRVLDFASGEALTAAGTEEMAAGITLIKERIAGVADLRRILPLRDPGGEQMGAEE